MRQILAWRANQESGGLAFLQGVMYVRRNIPDPQRPVQAKRYDSSLTTCLTSIKEMESFPFSKQSKLWRCEKQEIEWLD